LTGDDENTVVECGRGKGWSESMLYPRGDATGILFPEYVRGFKLVGELVSPWRVIAKAEQTKK